MSTRIAVSLVSISCALFIGISAISHADVGAAGGDVGEWPPGEGAGVGVSGGDPVPTYEDDADAVPAEPENMDAPVDLDGDSTEVPSSSLSAPRATSGARYLQSLDAAIDSDVKALHFGAQAGAGWGLDVLTFGLGDFFNSTHDAYVGDGQRFFVPNGSMNLGMLADYLFDPSTEAGSAALGARETLLSGSNRDYLLSEKYDLTDDKHLATGAAIGGYTLAQLVPAAVENLATQGPTALGGLMSTATRVLTAEQTPALALVGGGSLAVPAELALAGGTSSELPLAGATYMAMAGSEKGNAGKPGGVDPETATNDLASELHENWRKTRWSDETNSFTPRVKKTQDVAWIAKNGGNNEVDIANTPFNELPADWQGENLASARSAVSEIVTRLGRGEKVNDELIEAVSSVVHDQWLQRNPWAPEAQKLAYTLLSEQNKQLDRDVVNAALRFLATI